PGRAPGVDDVLVGAGDRDEPSVHTPAAGALHTGRAQLGGDALVRLAVDAVQLHAVRHLLDGVGPRVAVGDRVGGSAKKLRHRVGAHAGARRPGQVEHPGEGDDRLHHEPTGADFGRTGSAGRSERVSNAGAGTASWIVRV